MPGERFLLSAFPTARAAFGRPMAAGMGLGTAVGRWSGIMSGTMGAMVSVMMVNDNLVPFLYVLAGACIASLGGLSYLLRKEAGKAPEPLGGFAGFLLPAALLSIAMVAVMLYGPKGPATYP